MGYKCTNRNKNSRLPHTTITKKIRPKRKHSNCKQNRIYTKIDFNFNIGKSILVCRGDDGIARKLQRNAKKYLFK